MEELLKQARSKFRGKEELASTRERKTSSFRERGPQNWLKRQLSRQMSFKDPTEETEYAAAVAAAAFAITSLEPDTNMDQRQPQLGPQFSLPRIIRRIVEAATSEPNQEPERIRDEYEPEAMIPEKTIHPVPSIKRIPKKRLTFAEEHQEDTGVPSSYIEKVPTFDEGELEDAKRVKRTNSFTLSIPSMKRTPSTKKTTSMKRTPTFGEDPFDRENNPPSPFRQTTKEEISTAKPFPSTPIPPPPPAVPPLNLQPMAPPKGRQRPLTEMKDTDADEWEKEELAKIKARYDKLNATILEWEDKKRRKARHKLETTENELEKRKAKALQNYQIEMERIKEIADGARAQAREKRRNDELKVKEKANKYRATGEPPLPPVCLCL